MEVRRPGSDVGNQVDRVTGGTMQSGSHVGPAAGLTDIGDRLAEAAELFGGARTAMPLATDLGIIRSAARQLGMAAVKLFEELWNRSVDVPPGPVDVIDMFSGCGGMSAGFRAVNALVPLFRIAGAADIDPVANQSYQANIGVAPSHEDVSHLAADDAALASFVEKCRLRPDSPLVLIGCAPCQGFSSHRNSSGEGDDRNSLFVDFAAVAARLRPDAVVVENVPELLTHRYWPYVNRARQILEEAGYHVHVGVHNLADFGVPQERFRVLMLALPRQFAPVEGFLSRDRYRTVRDAIADLPKIPPGPPQTDDPLHYTADHRASTLEVIRAVPHDGGYRPADMGPPSLRRLSERQGKPGYEDIYGRLWWDRPAITITAYARNPASGRFVHPEQDRGLSVREAALLQGFPRSYWFAGSLDDRFRQIGNAVPPVFAAFLALYLAGELASEESPMYPAGKGIVAPVAKSFSRLIPALKAGRFPELAAR